MTDMRRSRIGRASWSRGPVRLPSGTTTSGLVIVLKRSSEGRGCANREPLWGEWERIWGRDRDQASRGRGDYQRCRRVTKPFGYLFGPGGSSTKPSVPASDVKSPDPFVGRGIAQARPQSSTSIRTGMKEVRLTLIVTSAPKAIFSGRSEEHT